MPPRAASFVSLPTIVTPCSGSLLFEISHFAGPWLPRNDCGFCVTVSQRIAVPYAGNAIAEHDSGTPVVTADRSGMPVA